MVMTNLVFKCVDNANDNAATVAPGPTLEMAEEDGDQTVCAFFLKFISNVFVN